MKILFLALTLSISAVTTYASQKIRFTADDLGAIVQLAKPERSLLVVDGLKGRFTPGPSLAYIGVQEQIFDIDLNVGGGLVDLRFNHFQALTPNVKFLSDKVQIEFPIQDQEKAIKSRVGSISMKNVKLITWIGFEKGNPEFNLLGVQINGQLKGSGLLKPKWVMDAVKKSVLRTLKNEMERQLKRPDINWSLNDGLMTWAKFSEYPNAQKLVPGSIQVLQGAVKPEVAYEVE